MLLDSAEDIFSSICGQFDFNLCCVLTKYTSFAKFRLNSRGILEILKLLTDYLGFQAEQPLCVLKLHKRALMQRLTIHIFITS